MAKKEGAFEYGYERKELIKIARGTGTSSYQDFCDKAFLDLDMKEPQDRKEVGSLLGKISRYEHSHGRPMLSVVIQHSGTEGPGPGFFKLAEELGRFMPEFMDEKEFLRQEFNFVRKYWTTHKG